MEEVRSTRHEEGVRSFRVTSATLSLHLHVFADPGSSETCPLGVLWRLHYISMVE